MKKFKLYFITSLFILGFISCQKVEESITIENTKLPISIVARIGDTEPTNARYAGTIESSTFTEGDAIGIFTDKGQVVNWNLGSIKWEPATSSYWPDTDNEHAFEAFYPYINGTTYTHTNIPMPNLLGQDGTFVSVASRDFLVASTTQKYKTSETITLQFSHKSALIHLTIKDTLDLADATLTAISIEGGNIVAPSYYSFEDSQVSLSPNNNSDVLTVSLNQTMDGNKEYYFVLNAKNSESENVKLTIKYTNNDKSYIAESDSFSGNVFTSGKQHDFTVAVKDNQISISGATINPWTPSEKIEDIIINNPQEI